MATGNTQCTCKICGNTFYKSKSGFFKSADARHWEEWAKANIITCSTCYGKQQAVKRSNEPLRLVVYLNAKDLDNPVSLQFTGNTKPVKEKIKQLGFQWTDELGPGLWDPMSINDLPYRWIKAIPLGQEKEEVKKCRESFSDLKIRKAVKNIDIDTYEKNLASKEEKEAEIAAIPKPQRPDVIAGGKWNGTIYGSEKNGFCLYVDDEKIPITVEEKREIEKYEENMTEYRRNVAELKGRW